MTAAIRWRARFAVALRQFQKSSASSTPMTSAVVIWSTRFRPILGNTWCRNVPRQCCSLLVPGFHVAR